VRAMKSIFAEKCLIHIENRDRKRVKTLEKTNHADRFLQSHDFDFDICRAFLVVSMMITHVFELFYASDYDRNFHAFATIGFIFLVGLTRSVLYGQKVQKEPRKYFVRFMRPALKLIVLFVVCNAAIILLLDERFSIINELSLEELMIQLLLGEKQHIYSFQILIPIAVTMFLSWFVLTQRPSRRDLPAAALLLVVFYFLERFKVCNLVGVHFALVGLIGTFVGQWISQLSWNKALSKISAIGIPVMAVIFILAYYVAMAMFKDGGVLFSIHVIPTIVILFFVYLLSIKLNLGQQRGVMIFAEILSAYMLFAYLFHIALINALFLVIPKDGLDFLSTVLVFFFVLGLTVACCFLLKYSTKKWSSCLRIYSIIFK